MSSFRDTHRFVRDLGKGSYGEVKLYTKTGSDPPEYVAAKVYNRSLMMKKIRRFREGDEIISECEYDKLKLEYELMKTIDHPNCVKLYDYVEDLLGDKIYIVIEYAPGGQILTWSNKFRRYLTPWGGEYNEPTARLMLADILSGLQYLHGHHIIHCDIKPENILLDKLGNCKITDFGTSQRLSEANQETGFLDYFRSTPEFTAPECSTRDYFSGYKSDIYALGVTLYALVIGKVPFYSDDIAELYSLVENSQPEYPRFISSKLTALLKGMLDKDPDTRFSLQQIRNHPWVLNIRVWDQGPIKSRLRMVALWIYRLLHFYHRVCARIRARMMIVRLHSIVPELDFSSVDDRDRSDHGPPPVTGEGSKFRSYSGCFACRWGRIYFSFDNQRFLYSHHKNMTQATEFPTSAILSLSEKSLSSDCEVFVLVMRISSLLFSSLLFSSLLRSSDRNQAEMVRIQSEQRDGRGNHTLLHGREATDSSLRPWIRLMPIPPAPPHVGSPSRRRTPAPPSLCVRLPPRGARLVLFPSLVLERRTSTRSRTPRIRASWTPLLPSRLMAVKEIDACLEKLKVLQETMGADGEDLREKRAHQDEFVNAKIEISAKISDIRGLIERRNQLQERGGNRRIIIETNSQIRRSLNEVVTDFGKLKELLDKELKRKRKKLTDDEKKVRQDIVEELLTQITELREASEEKDADGTDFNPFMESSFAIDAGAAPGGGDEGADPGISQQKGELFSGGGGGGTRSTHGGDFARFQGADVVSTEEPVLSDQQKQGLALIDKNDEEIDQMVLVIGEGLDVLKDIATQMNDELQKQSKKIDEIDEHMTDNQIKLDKNTKMLSDTLTKSKREDRLCTTLILIFLIVGLGLVIYNFVK